MSSKRDNWLHLRGILQKRKEEGTKAIHGGSIDLPFSLGRGLETILEWKRLVAAAEGIVAA